MKGAAKCDNHCELQNSVNQWILERALHFRDIPGSMPASVLVQSSYLQMLCMSKCVCVPCLIIGLVAHVALPDVWH
jgi:hypothetical protein